MRTAVRILASLLLLLALLACTDSYLGERGVNEAKRQIERYGECSLFNGAHVEADTAIMDTEGRLHLTMLAGKVRVLSPEERSDICAIVGVSWTELHEQFNADEVILTALERGGLEVRVVNAVADDGDWTTGITWTGFPEH